MAKCITLIRTATRTIIDAHLASVCLLAAGIFHLINHSTGPLLAIFFAAMVAIVATACYESSKTYKFMQWLSGAGAVTSGIWQTQTENIDAFKEDALIEIRRQFKALCAIQILFLVASTVSALILFKRFPPARMAPNFLINSTIFHVASVAITFVERKHKCCG